MTTKSWQWNERLSLSSRVYKHCPSRFYKPWRLTGTFRPRSVTLSGAIIVWTVVLLCVFVITSTANGQQAAPTGPSGAASTGAVGLKSGDLELSHSRVYIRVEKSRIGHDHAIIGKLQSGWLKLTPQLAGESCGRLIFDMTSFDADSIEARKYIGLEGPTDDSTRKQVNENMLGKEVLDVRKYPTATFNAAKVTKLDVPSTRNLPQYEIEGEFTLHGATRPIKFNVDVEDVKGWQRVRGAFAILQTQFGMKPFTKMFGAVGVADKLDIYGDLFVAP